MKNEELYQFMKDGFDQIRSEFNQRLDGMDARLRTLENGRSELKGKQRATAGIRNWITIVCALGAVIISVSVAIFK